ncbi:PHD finger protein 3 [Mortierella sp. GBA39]|nr:PHD finger protein 3 [Mortierella sp. GBA39]
MSDSSLQPDDFLVLDLAASDEDAFPPDGLQTALPLTHTRTVTQPTQATQAETESDEALAATATVTATSLTTTTITATTTAATTTPTTAKADSNTDGDISLVLASGGPCTLLADSLNSQDHHDEHVFLDFVHDPLSHSTPDQIVSGIDTGGDDGLDPHTDSQLPITLDPQDPSLEDIDIERPFVDLLGTHSTTLTSLDWATTSPQQVYGSLMDMELYKPSSPLPTTTQSLSLATSSTSLSAPTSLPSQQQQQQQPVSMSSSLLGTTTTASIVSDNAPSSDFVSPDVTFQPNGIYVDAQSDSEPLGTDTGSSNTSGKPAKPVHPSILRPLTPEEVMVPIAVRRSNRTRQPSTLAVQSSEYLMHSQGPYEPATPGPSAAGSSASTSVSGAAPVERMTRSKKVYCHCQKPDDGNVMIQCDSCRQWFHGACVDITEEVAEMMELKNEKFFCEPCDDRVQAWKSTGSADIGNAFTVYSDSRDCDLPTCLNEARSTSDYCSEECAIKGIELQATEAVMNKENIPPVVYIPTPKRVSISTASSSSQPESPRVEQDPIRSTALKGLTECLLIGLELNSEGGESQAESSEQADKRSGICLGKGAGVTGVALDEEQANRLAVAIEKELYSFTASPGFAACGRDYKAKYRSLFFNLKDKNNVSLRARLASGELEPYDLVRLSHEELANPELQIINKEMRKKSIHDSVLTVEEEPYIKKTHKGELSFVPRLLSVGGPSTVPYLDHTRSDDGSSVSSGSGGDDEHSPNNSRTDDIHNSNNTTLSRDINTSNNTTDGLTTESPMEYEESSADKQRDKDSHDSNINSATGSPTGDVLDKLLARIQTNKRSSEGTIGNTFASDKRQRWTGVDDYGIEDAERPETSYLPREPSPYSPSPPGSPAVHSTTPPDSPPPFLLENNQKAAQMTIMDRGAHRKQPAVWEGCLSMHQVAKFSAKAVQIGGRELFGGQDGGASRRQAWSDVLTKDIAVDGRIGIAAVEAYVGKQAQSATKEIVVLKFETQESSSLSSVRQRVEFDKLFEYFYAKRRNGVVPQRNRHIKDMYLVPLAAKDPLPGYLRELIGDDASVRDTVPTNCLLGVLVLNKEQSHSHSNHPHTRRAQPQSLSSQSKSTTPTSGRRRHTSPGASRPYPDPHGHHHDKRPAASLGHSYPSHAQLSGETISTLKAPTFGSGLPNTTSVAPHTASQSGPKLSPGDLSQPSVPVYTPQPIPSTTAGGPIKIPTLQELQGLVNQLFPSTRSASTLATGPPGVDPRPISAPGPTAAAAAVSAQLSGANMSSLMASLPASLSMNHFRQPEHQQSLEQHVASAPPSQGNLYAIPPAPPVFPPGMPLPPPPVPPNFVPLPPYLMAQYGLPTGPSMNPTLPAPPPPMPPVPPNPQQYFAHYFPGAQHLPPSAPPNSHPLIAASRNQGPRDPR